jgi:hypothetical protein
MPHPEPKRLCNGWRHDISYGENSVLQGISLILEMCPNFHPNVFEAKIQTRECGLGLNVAFAGQGCGARLKNQGNGLEKGAGMDYLGEPTESGSMRVPVA